MSEVGVDSTADKNRAIKHNPCAVVPSNQLMSRTYSIFLLAVAIISYVHASFDISLQCSYSSDVDAAVLDACVSSALGAEMGAIEVHVEDHRQLINLESNQESRELQNLCVYYHCSSSQANAYWCDRLNCPGWRRKLSEVAVSSSTLLSVELDLEDCIAAAAASRRKRNASSCTAVLSISE
jgi:hypothetical protein